jgi:hypothetical protein
MRKRGGSENDGERPRWREWDADDDDGGPRDWEIEPEEEKGDRHPVLGGTAPLARVIFLAIVLFVIVGGVIAFIRGTSGWFGD